MPSLKRTETGWVLRWGVIERTYTEKELNQLLSPEERELLVSDAAHADKMLGRSLILRRIFGDRARLIPAP
jgi:hypothetical protein